jgi:hypothetical protein
VRIVFAGTIGRLPVGGHAWVDMQYLAGLHQLGHDVVFLEDCGHESWVYDWDAEQLRTDLDYPAAYVQGCLADLGLSDNWIYRAGDESAGMPLDTFRDFCATADLLLIRAVPLSVWRAEYDSARKRAFIDADPGFTQIRLLSGEAELNDTVIRCDRLFTYGQRLEASDCRIPRDGRRWTPTVPPVALAYWPVSTTGPATHFTSVMQWRGFRDVEYAGEFYGQKDREFPRFIDLPRLTTQPFRLAVTGEAPENLERHGWEVLPGWIPSRTPWSYRHFIQQSRAEFGVAKHGYVKMRGGWFSDRSVCYLASGRPVLVEDTGLADWLPIGSGVVTFTNLDDAIAGVDRINSSYDEQCRAARRLAEERFDAARVLPCLLEAAMDGG